MPYLKKCLLPVALAAFAGALLYVPVAGASTTQQSIIQDDTQMKANPAGTLATFKALGIDRVRVTMEWDSLAPNVHSKKAPRGFKASNPAAYSAKSWAPYDAIVRDAAADGISVYFTLSSPAPLWAEGPGIPRGGVFGVWKPSAADFGQFVKAVGSRYSGSYKPAGSSTPLPRVSFWSIWNEPNGGPDLAPQTNSNGSEALSAGEYRGLLASAWLGLAETSHTVRRDTILIGETAPRGTNGVPGNFGAGVKPLTFLRALYCVGSTYKELRGSAAAAIGCPTTASASRRFRSANPALFQASGFADHPYTLQAHPVAPNVATNYYGGGKSDPNYADLPEIGRLSSTLNRLNKVYGSGKHLPIWNTEYGYRSKPPDRVGVSQANQAYYINWAEYLSYKQSSLASFMQYLLIDPANGEFASGLVSPKGVAKPSFDAFRMPLYLPSTSTKPGSTLEVWGDVRPAHFAGPGQTAQIQFAPSGGAYTTVQTVNITNAQGYFDVKVAFPSSGSVRIAWTPPGAATPDYSRTQTISIH